MMFPGIWPAEYEVREAARFGNYNWREWQELEGLEQAEVIAHYRLNNAIEAHLNDAVNAEIKRRQNQTKAKGGR